MHKPKGIHWKVALRILTYIKGFSGRRLLYKNHEHLRIEAFQLLTVREIKEIENLFTVIALMLEVIWLLGLVRNIVVYLVPVLKQSIERWLIQRVR